MLTRLGWDGVGYPQNLLTNQLIKGHAKDNCFVDLDCSGLSYYPFYPKLVCMATQSPIPWLFLSLSLSSSSPPQITNTAETPSWWSGMSGCHLCICTEKREELASSVSDFAATATLFFQTYLQTCHLHSFWLIMHKLLVSDVLPLSRFDFKVPRCTWSSRHWFIDRWQSLFIVSRSYVGCNDMIESRWHFEVRNSHFH